jgi:cell division cycle 2-like
MNIAKKRDRWASSSDEDDSKTKKSRRTDSRKRNAELSSQQPAKHYSATLTVPIATSTTPNNSSSEAKLTANNDDHNHLRSKYSGGCRSVYETYEKLERISEGSYGIVWKARCLKPLTSTTPSNSIMALKQMKFPSNNDNESKMKIPTSGVWKDGFPVMALREINALFALRQHTNIVSLHEIVVGGGGDDESSSYTATTIPPQIYMVMDYYHCDLKSAIQKYTTEIVEGPLLQSELMGIMQQIIQGLQYMHQHNYLHRDIKPSNILVKPIFHNTTGQYLTSRIAIADFGLTRKYKSNVHMTLPVVTLWYRAPELLFGETKYTYAIDIWSIGCIMGELVRSSGYSNSVTNTDKVMFHDNNYEDDEEYNNCAAILKGRGELDQIDAIFQLLGVPTALTWPSFSTLPNATLLRWKPIPEADILFPRLFPSMDGIYPHSSTNRNNTATTISLSNQTFLDRNGHDLLRQLLQLDPQQRIDANHALQHCYFTDGAIIPQIPNFSFL